MQNKKINRACGQIVFACLVPLVIFGIARSNEPVQSKEMQKVTGSEKGEITQIRKEKKTLTFKAEDGLEVTGDLSIEHPLSAPFVVLFHQAGWSRGEYQEIVPKLNQMGFNCLAVDQRSGREVNGVSNETHKRAVRAGRTTTYLDAYQDMKAAIKYAKSRYVKGRLIVWGSSYSAALAIKLASEYRDLVDGVLSFSPGEYFAKLGASKSYVTDAAKKVQCPIFITSAKDERERWISFYNVIPTKSKHSFLPETNGNHGSRALWEQFADNQDYWDAVTDFLAKYFMTLVQKGRNGN